MIRLAHCADLQLDSRALTAGVLDLDPETGLNRRLLDGARCWEAFVTGAIDAKVDLVIVAGDLFERPRPTPTEYRLFLEGLDRLLLSGSVGPTLLIAGNHDVPMSLVDDDALAPLVGRHDRLLISSAPKLFLVQTPRTLLQIVTLPYPRKAAISLKQEHEDLPPAAIGQRMIDLMERILDGFRAQLDPHLPSVLVPHVTVTGAAFSEAQPTVPIEVPSLPPEAFRAFTYTALGHIHTRQTFHDAATGYTAHYTGSMDRRDFGEEREDKSWDLVTLERSLPEWTVVSIEPRRLPARQFVTLDPADVRLLDKDEVGLDLLLAARPILRVKGQVTPAEADEILKITASWGLPVANALDVERETRARDTGQTGDLAPDHALRRYLEQQGHHTDEIDAMMVLHTDLSHAER